jgi:hypothetical protein
MAAENIGFYVCEQFEKEYGLTAAEQTKVLGRKRKWHLRTASK